ncbi:MAG TPA: cell division protein FtsZ [Polyangia bacterium]
MATLLEFDEPLNRAVIKVIGVGGGGGNAVNTMIAGKLDGVEFIAANTDMQALEANMAPVKCQLGQAVTRGLGAGANPEVGRQAALEDKERITEVLKGCDMVFVTAGMGGGTGTGGAPVIAEVARELGILTVGVVTKPFTFEGKRRRRQAEEGTAALAAAVDTLITIPNDRLLAVAGQKMTMVDAFRRVDEVLVNAVSGITDLISVHGLVNVDFADVKTVMANMGRALMGTGKAAGDNRALEAAKQAISSPLLEDVSIEGATGILINITGGPDLTLFEVNEAASVIQEAAHEDANIIFGSVIDANMKDEVRITVIATGFDHVHMRGREVPAHLVPPQPQPRRPPVQSQIPLSYAPSEPPSVRGAPVPHVPPPGGDIRELAGAPLPSERPVRAEAPSPPPRVPAERAPRAAAPDWPAAAPVERAPRAAAPDWPAAAPPPRRTASAQMPAVIAAPPPPAAPEPQPMPMPLPMMPPIVTLGGEDPDEMTDPTPVPIPQTPSARLRAERSSSPQLNRLHGILSPQDEAEIDIPTFLRRQSPPTHD